MTAYLSFCFSFSITSSLRFYSMAAGEELIDICESSDDSGGVSIFRSGGASFPYYILRYSPGGK
jgi:hypothetical protein